MRTKQKFGAVVLTMLVCLILVNAGSLGTRTVDLRQIQRVWDAVRIMSVTVGAQRIQPGLSGARGEVKQGTPFQADEDWLKNMSISLTNRTDKPIICAQIRLWFPDTGDGTPAHPMTSYLITIGQRPESSLYYGNGSKISPDTTKKALLLAPGATLVIPIAQELEAIQSTIEGVGNIPFSQVTRVEIEPAMFYFPDGMRWDAVAGGYYNPDPQHPGKYAKLNDSYFPGTEARAQKLE
jgi:hypothetical protein